MMLLIDIGNSRIKLGWLDRETGAREVQPLAVAHAQQQEVHDWLRTLPRAPVAAMGVNVAGDTLAQRLQTALGLRVDWLRSSACAGGVRNGYANPGQLGVDRWLAMIGLAARTRQASTAQRAHGKSQRQANADTPLMLASFGTATTIDTLSPQEPDGMRRFIGGVILPGASLMRSSLARHTANLPLAQGAAVVFPASTDQAIISGVCAAQAGALVRQWRHAFTHFARVPALYVSGGDWQQVRDAVQDAMTQAYGDLGMQAEPIRTIHAPVLDGLAALGMMPRSGLSCA